MNKDLKDKWVAALRSGKYKQGRLYLCKEGNYCCLGVLAEIDGKLQPGSNMKYKTVMGDECNFPGEYLDSIGLDNECAKNLVNLNDKDYWDFQEIADWIERNV